MLAIHSRTAMAINSALLAAALDQMAGRWPARLSADGRTRSPTARRLQSAGKGRRPGQGDDRGSHIFNTVPDAAFLVSATPGWFFIGSIETPPDPRTAW
jgi:hypothetical protein